MKKQYAVIVIIFLFLFKNSASAQINFEHGSWTEIKAKAKAEHKIIFLDAYTTWCGPCKWMAKTVFTNDTAAKYYNATFVNAKIDMEKGEGIEIAQFFKINVYPTLLYIDENGNMLHRAAGARNNADFVQLGIDAQNPEKQFVSLENKYKGGARDLKFMTTYLTALDEVYLSKKEPLKAYFSTQNESDLMNRTNWNLLYAHLEDHESREFNYLLKNSDAFAKKYSSDSVNNKIYDLYSNALSSLIYSKKADDAKFLQLKEEIKNSGFSRADELILQQDMNFYYNKKDYLNYAKNAIPYIDKYQNTNTEALNGAAYVFYENITDKTMLAKGLEWAKKCYELEPHPQFSMDTYACLLSVNGKKQEAIKMETDAIKLIKADSEKYDQSAIPDFEAKIAEWSKK